MAIIFRIAVRNLRQHKSKTFIIGLIIVLGITVLIVGNSMMQTASKGLERSFINNFSGHIELLAGALLKPGDAGIMLSEKTARDIKKDMKVSVKPGDLIVLSSFPGASALKVREVQVKGIFRLNSSNRKIDEINFMDMENSRILMGMTVSLPIHGPGILF